MVGRTVVVGDVVQFVAFFADHDDSCVFSGYMTGRLCRLAVGGDGKGGGTAGDGQDLGEGNQVARHGGTGDVGFVAAYAGGVLLVGNLAGGVVVALEGAVDVFASNGAVVVVGGGGHDGADGEVVVQGAVVVPACYAAVVLAVAGVGDGEGDGAGAAADGAAVVAHDAAVVAHDAAVEVGNGLHGADGYVGCHVAVADGAAEVISHDAAGVVVASDAGVGEGEVVDVGAPYLAEDALVAVGDVVASLVDADAADGVAGAVEVALEVAVVAVVVASDGHVVAFVWLFAVPSIVGGIAVGDVVGQLEVLAAVVARAVVDALGQEIELVLIIYHVGVVGIASPLLSLAQSMTLMSAETLTLAAGMVMMYLPLPSGLTAWSAVPSL